MAEKSYLPAFGVNTFQMPALTGVGLLARSLYYAVSLATYCSVCAVLVYMEVNAVSHISTG